MSGNYSTYVAHLEEGEEEVEVLAPGRPARGHVEEDVVGAARVPVLEGRHQLQRHRVRDPDHRRDRPEEQEKRSHQLVLHLKGRWVLERSLWDTVN